MLHSVICKREKDLASLAERHLRECIIFLPRMESSQESCNKSLEKKISRLAIFEQSESSYQKKLIKQFESEGYLVLKLIQINKAGYPDLLLLRPNGEIRFVEVKAKRGRLSKIQKYRIDELKKIGYTVEVLKSPTWLFQYVKRGV